MMKDHYRMLKELLYSHVEQMLARNDVHRNDDLRSDFELSAMNGITDGFEYASFVPHFILAYYLEGSPYYHDAALLERSYDGLCRYETYMHEDGSHDLVSCNYHDPAQSAFHTHVIFCALEVLVRMSAHTEVEDRLYDKAVSILRRSGKAMATLGFHTPNHRWAISAALSVAYRYTGERQFLDAIEGFLKEGVDCDETGQYTERSNGNYNNICNYSFMLMGFMLDREEFYDYPRRNLNMMYHFIEPDWSVNTMTSIRYDNGGKYMISDYYPYYLLLALMDRNEGFAYMADEIAERYGKTCMGQRLPMLLTLLTLHPEWLERQKEITPAQPEWEQSCFFSKDKIARVCRPKAELTMTALASRHPAFFQMNFGDSVLFLRFAGAFFGEAHSPFRAQTITPTEDGYRMVCEEHADYRSQFDEAPETSDWYRMDHSKRRSINVQHLTMTITLHLLADGVTMDIETQGCEHVPTKLEIIMQPSGKLVTDSMLMFPRAGDYAFLKQGSARYYLDHFRYFQIDGGFCDHLYAENMRGAFAPDRSRFTLALTTSTPQSSTVTIRARDLRRA